MPNHLMLEMILITLLLIPWHTSLMRMNGLQKGKSDMKVLKGSKEIVALGHSEQGIECLEQGSVQQQTAEESDVVCLHMQSDPDVCFLFWQRGLGHILFLF